MLTLPDLAVGNRVETDATRLLVGYGSISEGALSNFQTAAVRARSLARRTECHFKRYYGFAGNRSTGADGKVNERAACADVAARIAPSHESVAATSNFSVLRLRSRIADPWPAIDHVAVRWKGWTSVGPYAPATQIQTH